LEIMPASKIRSLIALFLLALAFSAFPAAAQNVGQNGSTIVKEQRAAMDRLRLRTDELEKNIAANAEDDAGLVDTRLQLEEAERELIRTSVAFRPRLAEINGRLDQLGPPPAEGQPPEPELVTNERQALLAEKAEINAALGVAEDQSIRMNALITRITEVRRDLFSRQLTRRYDIGSALAGEVAAAAQIETGEFYRTVSSWLRFVVQFKLRSVLFATFFALLAAAILLIGGRRLFGRLFEADGDVESPSYLSRLSVAFWSTLVPTAAIAVFLATTYLLYDYFGVLRGDIGTMMTWLFIVIGLVFFVHRLGSSVLSPRLPNWRLIAVDTRAARLLLWLVSATAIFTGIDVFLRTVYGVLDSPLSLTVGESLIATVLTGILVVLIGLVRPSTGEDGGPRQWHPLLRSTLFLLGGITIAAALFGYIGFAQFLSTQIVVTGAVLATMYIGFLSARAVAEEGAFANTALGRRIEGRFGLDPATLDQLALVVSTAINILIVVVGVPLILFLWGFQPADIQAWVYRAATGITIGSFTISFTGILSGVLVFILGFFLTRWFQGWLDGSVMARGKVDAGVRNSIRTVIGYAGLALAALVGVSAAGIDLSNFALIAGGLSLGIGFGLQNVVSNFVSGLILLAERPFKAGDWIVAGAVSGTVKKISVRATEIETFQRQTVILPNSELINSAVGNWTHRNKLGRVDIKVNVAYDSDSKRAHDLMLGIAREHPLVLKNPEPFVLFVNFGPAALEFEIRVFIADILNGNTVQNDIRFAILEAFERENIAIPSTARFIPPPPEENWPTDDDKLEAEHFEQAKASEEKARQPPAQRRKGRKPDPD
jgi:potassium efflux system protein